MVSQRPGRHLKMILRLVAPFSQSMSPWWATATHFVPKSIIIDMSKTCPNDKKPHNLIHRLSKWSIGIKKSTNVSTKLHVFDIRLPQGSLFDNPDYVNLALCAQSFRYQVLGTFLINKSWELRVRCPQGLFSHQKSDLQIFWSAFGLAWLGGLAGDGTPGTNFERSRELGPIPPGPLQLKLFGE